MTTCLEDLHESNEFLNILLANINSAVLVVDENLQIHQFNDFFIELFDSSLDTFVEKSFGQVTRCVNAVVENKPCGQTSQCQNCILRRSLVQTLVEKVPADKTILDRIFYINGEAKQKHLEFSTRPIRYQGQKLILVIIYDVTDIEEKNIELKKKQQQIEQDLKAAAAIQQSLLPNTLPDIPKIDMAYRFEPCGQIGGDIFNAQSLDDTSIGLYMLDVCGHGVPAALIAVTVSQFLQGRRDYSSLQPERIQPHTILERLNQSFPFERFDSYFSIIYTAIDFERGVLSYSCAGHPPPIILQPDGFIEELESRGTVIGLSSNQSYQSVSRQLNCGDRLVLYTDGMIECRNRHGEYFGKKRFIETLAHHCNKPLQEMIDGVYSTMKDHLNGFKPDDDISFMVVEYTG